MKVELDLMETAYLCDMGLERILTAGGTNVFLFGSSNSTASWRRRIVR